MADLEKLDTNFLKHWFEGLIRGLEKLDEADREIIMRSCGQVCARSYTAKVFKDAWEYCCDIDSFLQRLGELFPEAVYDLHDDETIEVRYQYCACDLVELGWVDSPMLCRCSANNLQANLVYVLGDEVEVSLIKSILRGDKQCIFRVKFNQRLII